MRKILLTLVLVFLVCTPQARAAVSVSFGGGFGHGYHGSYFSHGHSSFFVHRARFRTPFFFSGYSGDYYDDVGYSPYLDTDYDSGFVPPAAPTPAITPASPPAPQPAQKQAVNQIPYGFDIGTKIIKSPWSGFVINGATKAPEQVVYDANTGQAFRIPPLP